MWLYVKDQLINMDYVTWVTKKKGKKNFEVCLSQAGDEFPIVVDFAQEEERDHMFDTLIVNLVVQAEPIEGIDEEGQETLEK